LHADPRSWAAVRPSWCPGRVQTDADPERVADGLGGRELERDKDDVGFGSGLPRCLAARSPISRAP
jgi:hypothetical protein